MQAMLIAPSKKEMAVCTAMEWTAQNNRTASGPCRDTRCGAQKSFDAPGAVISDDPLDQSCRCFGWFRWTGNLWSPQNSGRKHGHVLDIITLHGITYIHWYPPKIIKNTLAMMSWVNHTMCLICLWYVFDIYMISQRFAGFVIRIVLLIRLAMVVSTSKQRHDFRHDFRGFIPGLGWRVTCHVNKHGYFFMGVDMVLKKWINGNGI